MVTVPACWGGCQWFDTPANSLTQVAGTQLRHTPSVPDCFSASTLGAIAAGALSESANLGEPAIGYCIMPEPAPSSNWQIVD